MREHHVEFEVSTGLTVGALLRTPDHPSSPCPVVIHCPGWMSTKDANHYRRYHDYLADQGAASLVFDYRYTVVSHEPQVLDPAEFVVDAIAAHDRLSDPDVPLEVGATVFFGSGGIGAGVAIAAAASIPSVTAVVALSPIASGERWLRWMRRPYEYRDLRTAVDRDREARLRGEEPVTIRPVGGISLPPPERARSGFKSEIAGHLPAEVALESVERILQFDVAMAAADLNPRSLLLIACRDDVAVPYEDAEHLRDVAGPSARLVTLEATSSYDMHRTRWRDIAAHLVEAIEGAKAATRP